MSTIADAMRILFTFFGLLIAFPLGAALGVDLAGPSRADVLWISKIVADGDWEDGQIG